MFNSTIPRSLKVAVAAGFISALAFSPVAFAAEQGKENLDASASKEITGEVVDMMCYVDHNAMGDKHSACAAKCIKGGGPFFFLMVRKPPRSTRFPTRAP